MCFGHCKQAWKWYRLPIMSIKSGLGSFVVGNSIRRKARLLHFISGCSTRMTDAYYLSEKLHKGKHCAAWLLVTVPRFANFPFPVFSRLSLEETRNRLPLRRLPASLFRKVSRKKQNFCKSELCDVTMACDKTPRQVLAPPLRGWNASIIARCYLTSRAHKEIIFSIPEITIARLPLPSHPDLCPSAQVLTARAPNRSSGLTHGAI